ncbi:unnamed protein product, partial [Didymodactylos carnosus]
MLTTDSITASQFTFMISYSHSDKNICHKLYQQLTDHNFKVWIDLDGIYAGSWDSMARGIDQSKFVLICMSEAYEKSTTCQREADYAHNQRSNIIPLVVSKGYRAKGWLGILIGARNYTDFTKTDFDTAYEKLMKEIANQTPGFHVPLSRKSFEPSQPLTESNGVSDTHLEIIKWSEKNIQDFLRDKKLTLMIPIMKNINGEQLIDLYKRSKNNSTTVYDSLNSQLRETNKITLPRTIYSGFINEIEKIISTSSSTTTQKNIKLRNDERRASSFKYDIMIDNCWKDKNIASAIRKHLIEDNYSVWTYTEDLHGNIWAGVASAVDNSKIIIICMSTGYNESKNCHHTADYVEKSRRSVIPVVVESGFSAKEWLKIMFGGLRSIDFTEQDFESAYKELLRE